MCECVFCHKEKIITDFIYEDGLVMAFMDMEPINEGHILLVPKQHYLDADEIPDELLAHLMIVSKKIVAALKEIYHPEHTDMYYPINYGYVEGVMAPDGEEQDAYILGVDEVVEKFTGKIIAVVHRNDDVEEKWIVAPAGMTFTKEEIREQIHFQEQYFDSEIVM